MGSSSIHSGLDSSKSSEPSSIFGSSQSGPNSRVRGIAEKFLKPEDSAMSGTLINSKGSSQESGSASQSGSGASSAENGSLESQPHVTFRFEHAQDGHGNHVIVGREGKLRRCEDEVSVTAASKSLSTEIGLL